ncbi:hypothetical protein M422DRAFT_49497 [Sphaerobolus stellatus SS14]|uniref:Uncharacterized protein n=1 Tax=Sphaerobolus stellatus (strain SS14) TaxID=990650 RepID=A0A0C9VEG3_SPHS4|nr:hypothetical protein M422DRAFT_49497 [Sphaerobolus stellatus SS14]
MSIAAQGRGNFSVALSLIWTNLREPEPPKTSSCALLALENLIINFTKGILKAPRLLSAFRNIPQIAPTQLLDPPRSPASESESDTDAVSSDASRNVAQTGRMARLPELSCCSPTKILMDAAFLLNLMEDEPPIEPPLPPQNLMEDEPPVEPPLPPQNLAMDQDELPLTPQSMVIDEAIDVPFICDSIDDEDSIEPPLPLQNIVIDGERTSQTLLPQANERDLIDPPLSAQGMAIDEEPLQELPGEASLHVVEDIDYIEETQHGRTGLEPLVIAAQPRRTRQNELNDLLLFDLPPKRNRRLSEKGKLYHDRKVVKMREQKMREHKRNHRRSDTGHKRNADSAELADKCDARKRARHSKFIS